MFLVGPEYTDYMALPKMIWELFVVHTLSQE